MASSSGDWMDKVGYEPSYSERVRRSTSRREHYEEHVEQNAAPHAAPAPTVEPRKRGWSTKKAAKYNAALAKKLAFLTIGAMFLVSQDNRVRLVEALKPFFTKTNAPTPPKVDPSTTAAPKLVPSPPVPAPTPARNVPRRSKPPVVTGEAKSWPSAPTSAGTVEHSVKGVHTYRIQLKADWTWARIEGELDRFRSECRALDITRIGNMFVIMTPEACSPKLFENFTAIGQ